MRSRRKINGKCIGALLLCLVMVSSFAGCKKNDANCAYDINEVGYDTYIEYENMLLSVETDYLNDEGYVESSDIPAMLDEVEQLAQQGVSDGTIAYYNREDDNVFIKFASGIPYLFIPYEKDKLSGGGGGQILTIEPTADDYSVNLSYVIAVATAWGCGIEYEDSLRPSSNANLIVENVPDLYTYDYRYPTPYDVVDPIRGAGASLRNSNVTIDGMKALADYKVIIWEGHGAYNETIHSALITGESFLGWKDFSKYKTDLEDNTIILTSFPTIPETDIAYSPIRYYGITSKFVEKYIGDMDEALVFLGACSSLKDEVLAQSFLDKGASVVLGYTDITTMYYEMISRTVFFTELVKEIDSGYQTVAEACRKTIQIVGYDDSCVMNCISREGVSERYTLKGIIDEPVDVEDTEERVPQKQLSQVNQYYSDGCVQYNFSYNNEGMLTAFLRDSYFSTDTRHYGYAFEYENGRLTQYRDDEFGICCEYFYDADGVLTGRREWEYGDWYIDYECEYNEDGQLIREFATDGSGTTVYTYDADGKLITSSSEKHYGDMSGVSEKTYTYDSNGRLAEVTSTSDWGMGASTELVKYSYDYAPFIRVDVYGEGEYSYSELILEDSPVGHLVSFHIDNTDTFTMDDGYLTKIESDEYTLEFLYDGATDESFESHIPAPRYEDEITGTYLAKYEDVEIIIEAENSSEYYLTYIASGVTLERIPLAYFNSNTSTEKWLMFVIDDYYPEYGGYVEICWTKNSMFPYSYNAMIEGLDDTDGYYSDLTKTGVFIPAN